VLHRLHLGLVLQLVEPLGQIAVRDSQLRSRPKARTTYGIGHHQLDAPNDFANRQRFGGQGMHATLASNSFRSGPERAWRGLVQ